MRVVSTVGHTQSHVNFFPRSEPLAPGSPSNLCCSGYAYGQETAWGLAGTQKIFTDCLVACYLGPQTADK
jgi:hypothetical protein